MNKLQERPFQNIPKKKITLSTIAHTTVYKKIHYE